MVCRARPATAPTAGWNAATSRARRCGSSSWHGIGGFRRTRTRSRGRARRAGACASPRRAGPRSGRRTPAGATRGHRRWAPAVRRRGRVRRTASAAQMAYETGRRIVEMVEANLRPSDIMTQEGLRERRRGGLGDRRVVELPDPHGRHRAAHGRGPHRRGLAARRRRHPAAGRLPAGRALSRRGLLSAPAASRR